MEEFLSIPGLDMEKGISQHGGNQANYLKVLRSYMVSIKSKLDIVENGYENDLKQYEITVHGIKGSSRGICADDLGHKFFELEKAAESGNLDFIKKYNPIFLDELKTFLNNLELMFNNKGSDVAKPVKNKPDKEVLEKLLEACDIYDMMEVEAAMEEISKYQYDNDDGLAEWLQSCSEAMQYEEITEKLTQLIKDNAY